MKNMSVTVCEISPDCKSVCEHSREAVGIPVKFCACTDACSAKTVLKHYPRTRAPKPSINNMSDTEAMNANDAENY